MGICFYSNNPRIHNLPEIVAILELINLELTLIHIYFLAKQIICKFLYPALC